jgi:hypothetical protein
MADDRTSNQYKVNLQIDEGRRQMVQSYNEEPGEAPHIYQPLKLEDVIRYHPDSTDKASHRILLPLVNHRVNAPRTIPPADRLKTDPPDFGDLSRMASLTWRKDSGQGHPTRGRLVLPQPTSQSKRRSVDVAFGIPKPPQAAGDFYTSTDPFAAQRELGKAQFSLPNELVSKRERARNGNYRIETAPSMGLDKVIDRLAHYHRRLSEI